jgi:hypothetical protein
LGQAVAIELVGTDSIPTLTLQQYQHLSDVPPEVEWLANITNPKTRRFYKSDVAEFVSFTGQKGFVADLREVYQRLLDQDFRIDLRTLDASLNRFGLLKI